MTNFKTNTKLSIAYSCYYNQNREGEQFTSEHVLSFQISGTLTVNTLNKEYIFKEGDFRFIKRNQLIKFLKQPSAEKAFKSVSIYLDQNTLRNFSMQYDFDKSISKNTEKEPVILLKENPLLKSFMDSLLPYLENDQLINPELQTLKLHEVITILLQYKPELKYILFDFNEPGKIDLEVFMKKNFHFNVDLNRFAYLTGRSLATFKRDFQKIFNNSPSKWLQQQRLEQAYYLIKEKNRKPSDVYLEIGFEDLSHFSFAFKNKFGVSPSKLS